MFALIFVATPLLFPTGRLLSARWRPVAAVAALVTVALVLLAALQPTIKLQDQDYWVDNPIGVAGIPDPETSRVAGVLLGFSLPASWWRSSAWCCGFAAPVGWSDSSSSGSSTPGSCCS